MTLQAFRICVCGGSDDGDDDDDGAAAAAPFRSRDGEGKKVVRVRGKGREEGDKGKEGKAVHAFETRAKDEQTRRERLDGHLSTEEYY